MPMVSQTSPTSAAVLTAATPAEAMVWYAFSQVMELAGSVR